MGNCLFGGLGEEANYEEMAIKVTTTNGGIMEFVGPITAECITDEFPGHRIFREQDLFWKPLPHQELLTPGGSYYLLQLTVNQTLGGISETRCQQVARVGHVRSNSVPESPVIASYRMSFDGQGRGLKKLNSKNANTGADMFFATPHYGNSVLGMWKVKLVISPKQLSDILSQEDRTQELIESVRTVAKCGNIALSSVGYSDQWSLSSSSGKNTISNRSKEIRKQCLLEI